MTKKEGNNSESGWTHLVAVCVGCFIFLVAFEDIL